MRGIVALLIGTSFILYAGSIIFPMSQHKKEDTSNLLDRSQMRSLVMTQRGIVAASQTLAAQAGAQILARGGSAADAAIAANAVMGVVEPMNSGVGGDLFALEWDAKTGKLTGLNASGWAPQGMTIDFLRKKGYSKMPGSGIDSVTVPGCVEGWWKLHQRFGRLPWAELFQPAIYYALHGFPVTEWVSAYWQAWANRLTENPEARRVFLPGGRPPKTGEIFRNPEYARALELIAAKGEDAFYRGEIARAIIATSKGLGGIMTASDLDTFQAEWVEPISTTYRGWQIYELPPNGQGMAALEMLNIMQQFPLSQYPAFSAEALHIKMEAQKLAYADLFHYLGDPRFVKVPVAGLLSKTYASERARLINLHHANCDVQPGVPPGAGPSSQASSHLNPGADTIYLAAVDREGNIVSLIQSLSASFGSGVAVQGFGILLQNRGAGFLLEPGKPDSLAPHKRPFHTIIPAFMQRGNLHVGFGIMGGLNQPQAHAQFVSDIVDYGMNIQAALEAPRFTKLDRGGCDFMIEDRVTPAAREELIRLGHVLEVRGNLSTWMGGGQAVMHDSVSGVNSGASDPRKDGEAIPEPVASANAQSPK